MRRRVIPVTLAALVVVSCLLVLGFSHHPSRLAQHLSQATGHAPRAARHSLEPLALPVPEYLPAGSVEMQRNQIPAVGGHAGWNVLYQLPGSPRRNRSYPFRWLAITVFENSTLPTLVSSGRGPLVTESRHTTTISGYPGVLYTASSPDGVIELEWRENGSVVQVQTCVACKVPLAALRGVASHLHA